jgi:hypothetical protein
MWKEAIMVYIKVLSQHLSGRAEDNRETPRQVNQPQVKVDSYKIFLGVCYVMCEPTQTFVRGKTCCG